MPEPPAPATIASNVLIGSAIFTSPGRVLRDSPVHQPVDRGLHCGWRERLHNGNTLSALAASSAGGGV